MGGKYIRVTIYIVPGGARHEMRASRRPDSDCCCCAEMGEKARAESGVAFGGSASAQGGAAAR